MGRLMAGGVKEVDHGWKRIQRTMLAKAGPEASRVGIQGPESTEDHGGPSNVMVMSTHEFGSPTRGIPERAPMRSVFDKNRKKYERGLKKLGDDMVTGKTTKSAGLTMLGEDYRSDIIDAVRKGKIKPALAQSTLDARMKKGGKPAKARAKKPGKSENIPLWDTGQMMGALTTVLER